MGTPDHTGGEDKQHLLLKHAVENTNDAFVTIDANHKVLFFNKAAEKIFGYSRDEVLEHDLDVIMAPDCSRNHREAVARYIKTKVPGRIGHESEIMAKRKNGDTFPAAISFSVTELAGKYYFTAIVRDLTETRALQAQIMKTERLAVLGQFVAEVSHEIKNPLMMIGGFAQQLGRATKNPKSRKKLHIMGEEIRRLEKLLADLREFYLPKTPASHAVDLKHLLEGIISLVKEDCEAKNIPIRLNVEDGARMVIGDRDRLNQVFLNLIKNAMDAMAQGGMLFLTSRNSENRIDVTVRDEGCGISEEEREKIFSPFYTTKRDGTGLGLCISKRIIEEHEGGRFSLESEKGKGSAFTISLPKYDESAEKVSPPVP